MPPEANSRLAAFQRKRPSGPLSKGWSSIGVTRQRPIEHEEVSSASTRPRAMVLGTPVDRLDMDQSLRRCVQAIESGEYLQHVVVNVAKLVALQDDESLREIVHGCALINADGQGVVWASRLLGDPLPERVAGIDLMFSLLTAAERRGFRVYVLGARAEVLERAVERLQSRYPGLQVAGYRDGYFSESDVEAVCADIRDAQAQILFVAMSSPRKEQFLGEHGTRLGVPLVMGVGGAIDVVAGTTRRAPRTLQRLGLEWLFRMLQEPRRLGPRYLVTNRRFATLLLGELRSRRTRRCAPAAGRGESAG
jgi:N-acetylglucosaminyldiphosphoundecaprenol N-acetyl-beta-D-mannosaminyltransferase